MEDAMCISFDLVKFGFGSYQGRPDFDNKIIINSLFDTHASYLIWAFRVNYMYFLGRQSVH